MIYDTMVQLAGAAGGTALGAFFGFRGALNGMRETVKDTKATVTEIRDIARDTHFEVVEARRKLEHITSLRT